MCRHLFQKRWISQEIINVVKGVIVLFIGNLLVECILLFQMAERMPLNQEILVFRSAQSVQYFVEAQF